VTTVNCALEEHLLTYLLTYIMLCCVQLSMQFVECNLDIHAKYSELVQSVL